MAGKLYTPPPAPTLRTLSGRMLLVLGLILCVTLIVYFEGGLKDTHTGEHPGFWDCLYFALITITTVGYGDIVPVDTFSRLMDAFVLTPVRFIVILTIFGTAYQIALRRFQEEYRMQRIQDQLQGHTILCGFGASAQAALEELLREEEAPPSQIVVIDQEEAALELASEAEVICLRGDATREHVLQSAAIEKAAHALVCPGRDDTAALITLTIKNLSPKTQITAMCHERENMKLLERAGAHHIVSPAFAGGALMAAATRQEHLADTLKDLLSVGGALKLNERAVSPEEVGKLPAALDAITVVRVYRKELHYAVDKAGKLQAGDILVYIQPNPVS